MSYSRAFKLLVFFALLAVILQAVEYTRLIVIWKRLRNQIYHEKRTLLRGVFTLYYPDQEGYLVITLVYYAVMLAGDHNHLLLIV